MTMAPSYACITVECGGDAGREGGREAQGVNFYARQSGDEES